MEELTLKWSETILPWLLNHGIKIVFIAAGAWILNKVLGRIIIRTIRIAVVADPSQPPEAEKKREDTLIMIFKGAMRIAIITLAVLMVLQEAGLKIGPVLAGAGIVGLAFGFGGQYLIRDVITGLFIILENQYRIGDVIQIDDEGGLVEDISLRKTTLRDLNGTVHHIPHGEIKVVSNLTRKYSRVNIDIGVSYSSDLDHVIKVINRTGNDLAQDPDFRDKILTPPQFLRVDEFADSSIVVKILGDTKPLMQWEVAGEFRKRIKVAFDKEGIEIPFPQRVVYQAKS
ncbi:MAG: mechanosensitive ion channel family protein [Bacteroidales bacterium]|jgi:small conductance mechanosensitive channel|nr:mechanosensitive ion channel family protein [Bacteroidales bacterium]